MSQNQDSREIEVLALWRESMIGHRNGILALLNHCDEIIREIDSRIDLETNRAMKLEESLEALAWTPARSGNCDYAHNVPLELVQEVRSTKGGIKGKNHHFTAHATDPTLFRFNRRAKQ